MKITPIPVPETADVPLQQHPSFARAVGRIGRSVHSLGFIDGAHCCGTVQIITRHLRGLGQVALASRGPVFHHPMTPDQITSAYRNLAQYIPHLAFIANTQTSAPLQTAGYAPLMTPAHIAQLDLRGTPDHRMARLHQKWRNRLRRTQEGPLTVTTALYDPQSHLWLLKQDAAQQRTRGYKNWSIPLTLAFAMENPKHMQVFTACIHETPVAGMIFLRHGAQATYHIGYTSDQGRRHNAHTLLLWHAVNWLAEQGHITLDLGMVDTEVNPDLARFKLGTGAKVIQLGGTWLHSSITARLIRYFHNAFCTE
ncbi:GNAT family N-acetyltransferase [Parasulfitobacter algicola]|uniref:GNAT family N-acetyltransferase n=1 Tax=Parasulfitobacter algicola TaxID=2614809 RepID=A0ABX2IQI2_9RHOB|nr:GNAT family N-acetyltransferase [Sulfitobacter algicola]NSX55137.1 GNAT family N-acetyltransferase [Sulfitobacter algicola]